MKQEKYTNMLKRKNKEKNIYKNKNSTLRIEKMNLIKAVERKDKEIERLKKREQECIDHYLVQCKYASEMEEKYITANNSINEFEKLLKEERTRTKYAHDVERFTAYDYMLKRLQELKHKKIYGSVDSEIVYFDELGSDK